MKIAVFLFALCFAVPLRAATIVADPFPPAKFTSLYIEKDDENVAIIIQLAGEAVTYSKIVDGKVVETATAHPDGDDWFKFIQGLNTAKVYKWSPKYYYPGRGTAWEIDLAMDTRQFSSSGTNEFPLEGAEEQPQASPNAGPSVPFQFMWQAALVLVGKMPPTKGQAGG